MANSYRTSHVPGTVLRTLLNHLLPPEGQLGSHYYFSPFTHAITEAQFAAAAKSLQSCPTLCDPVDGSPLGSSVPGTLQGEYWSGLPFPSPVHESEK